MKATEKTVFVIAGPTAVGKTAIAIQLAKKLGTEIVSADSRQCYEGMTIGTAKPTQEELHEVKHYFIDEFPVTRSLTASDFEYMALDYLEHIFKTHDTAVVVGGTGLYIKALCDGLDEMPDVDEQIAYEVNSAYEEHGLDWLQHAVHEEDPEFYDKGEIKNPARLMRALIFKRSTGESIVNYRKGEKKQRHFRIIKIGLELPREQMIERIGKRVDDMMANGLLGEVKMLYPFRHLKNLQTVGYTELFACLAGKCTEEEAVKKIKQNTRNYAKRQMTWFKKDKEVHWLKADDPEVLDKILALR